MACAASIFPFSISRRLLSTILAYIGIQLAAMAMIHAFVPYALPKISLATGIMRMIIIICGNDLKQLMIQPDTVYEAFRGTSPSGLVTVRSIPIRSPNTSMINEDTTVL